MRASDRRAQFVGLDAYEQAGGVVLRDLFEHDDGGWLQDVPLLDRLVTEKLKAEAETIAAEGWKWIAVAVDFPYGHTNGLRELDGEPADLTDEEQATLDALNAEYAKLEADYQDADELPDEVDQRLGEIETALVGLRRSIRSIYDPAEIARAGVFVSIDAEGRAVDRSRLCPAGGRGARVADPEAEDRATARPSTSQDGQWLRSSAPSSRSAARRPNRRGGRRRRDQAAAGSARHRADRASHAGAARRAGEQSAGRLPGAAAQALPGDLLPLRVVGRLPGDRDPARRRSPLRRPT